MDQTRIHFFIERYTIPGRFHQRALSTGTETQFRQGPSTSIRPSTSTSTRIPPIHDTDVVGKEIRETKARGGSNFILTSPHEWFKGLLGNVQFVVWWVPLIVSPVISSGCGILQVMVRRIRGSGVVGVVVVVVVVVG
jgi:hypothetical protein